LRLRGLRHLLDEHCAGVNPSLVGGLSSLLKELNRTRKGSFVVIEHSMNFVMDLCHRIMVMVEGKVMAIGTPAEIRANKQVLDAYLSN
jgi:branched-chain amino acid transport system ATP-binding protein